MGKKLLLVVSVLMVVKSVSVAMDEKNSWVHPTDRDAYTLYYQGTFASQAQVSKYTGTRGFIATTGEYVVCTKAIDVIEKPFIGTELIEIKPKVCYKEQAERLKDILKHPIRALEECINKAFQNDLYGIKITTVNPEQRETLEAYTVHLNDMALAQDADIEQHRSRYELCIKEHPQADIILYGVSRGAATTFNAAATCGYDLSKIRLIVLEACFDSVSGAADDSPLFLGVDIFQRIFVKIMAAITQFQSQGKSPISLVHAFPEHVPVIFISSQTDIVVPVQSVRRLVRLLRIRGKNPIYLLVLQHSSHPKYMMDNKEDAQNYRDCMHALYKSLNLPYIPEYALAGEQKGLLDRCRIA